MTDRLTYSIDDDEEPLSVVEERLELFLSMMDRDETFDPGKLIDDLSSAQARELLDLIKNHYTMEKYDQELDFDLD